MDFDTTGFAQLNWPKATGVVSWPTVAFRLAEVSSNTTDIPLGVKNLVP